MQFEKRGGNGRPFSPVSFPSVVFLSVLLLAVFAAEGEAEGLRGLYYGERVGLRASSVIGPPAPTSIRTGDFRSNQPPPLRSAWPTSYATSNATSYANSYITSYASSVDERRERPRSGRPTSFGDVWHDVSTGVGDTFGDMVSLYTAPARIDKRSALWLGGFVAVGGLLYAYDGDLHDALKRNEFVEPYKWVRDTGEFFEPVALQGNINKYLIGGMVVGYATGLEPVTLITSDILRSFLLTAIPKETANELVGRRGPLRNEGPRSFERGDGRSFPSGHSLAVSTLARVITYRIPYWPVQAVAYTMMGTVLLQRVTSDHHWPSDAYTGGLYGWFATDHLLRRRDARRLEIVPTYPSSDVGPGVGMRLTWH